MKILIETKGLAELELKLRGTRRFLAPYIEQAGQEAGREIIDTQGLRRYPPATAANFPPPPYYIRGVGTQLKHRNLGNSERYGSQWVITSDGTKTTLGNNASYARYLAGEEQAHFMAPKGWRKLFDVANEKIAAVIKIYEGWIGRGLTDNGL